MFLIGTLLDRVWNELELKRVFLIPLILFIYFLWNTGTEEIEEKVIVSSKKVYRRFNSAFQRSTIQKVIPLTKGQFFVAKAVFQNGRFA